MFLLSVLEAGAIFFAPLLASAHEVYVLTPGEVASDTAAAPFNMIATAADNLGQFGFWAFIATLVIFIVFFVSISRRLEQGLAKPMARLHRYAAPIARITVGLSFLAAAYYQATYGPELPLSQNFGTLTPFITAVLAVVGLLIVFGIFVRTATLATLALFAVAVWKHGLYMLTYTNYLGEILVLLILGAHHGVSRLSSRGRASFHRFAEKFAPYSFALLRVCFGISLLYASLYAKILHNNLALQVVSLPLAGHAHSIAYYFGFDPHFMVLGAAIVEIVIALFFIFGLEIRFTSLFLLFWLSLSLGYFGEVVWPHVILIGIPIAFICSGYDRYSLEGWLFKKGGREPVL